MALRVLYVNPFSQEVSGPDESLQALMRPLMPLGVEPHVVLPRPGPHVTRYQKLGATVHYAPTSILQRRLPPLDAALLGARIVRGAAAVAGLARRIKADLIHTNMEVVLDGGLAARWLGIPHVMHYRGNTLDQPREIFDLLTRVWTTLADRVFCISHATAGIFLRRARGAKVSVLYNPVDVAAFAGATRSTAARAALGIGGDAPVVGTVGRIHPRKDLETFVRACAIVSARHPGARFVIVGAPEGPQEQAHLEALRRLALDLGLGERLTFAGAHRDMPAIFKALDVFVLSSRHEGFGRVLAEAMAAGIPSVVSREGALPELLEHGTHGFCATPGVPEEFAREIALLLDDPGLRATLGQAAQARSVAFDAAAVAAHVMTTYQTLCASRGQRRPGPAARGFGPMDRPAHL
jgi:glycosyltransferase involved in cell wall biosynthesis